MIIFFGPAGAGKSSQGKLLANAMGWPWLSAGQLLRETQDPELLKKMDAGELVPHESVTRVMGDALKASSDQAHVILDGFPRELEQAKWLISSPPEHGRAISLVIILDVPRDEVLRRLAERGRADDQPEAIDTRLESYQKEITPILNYFDEQHIPSVHVDGVGTPEEVQVRIVEVLKAHGLTS